MTEPWFVWYWPNSRSRTTHAYVTGPGALDTSLCGKPLVSVSKPSQYARDPRCVRCSALAVATPTDAEAETYVCPQCGPDPAGAYRHAETHHTWPTATSTDSSEEKP